MIIYRDMITKAEAARTRARAARMLEKAGIVLAPGERGAIEVADFGLSDLAQTGLEIVVYVNNPRYCAKELIMFPGQTCPQHRHPPFGGGPGKMETFRCRWGEVHLYLPGRRCRRPKARPPRESERHYTVWREVTLKPGQQKTVQPGTWHWFQAGRRGAIVSEFSSTSKDEKDVFTDPRIRRATVLR